MSRVPMYRCMSLELPLRTKSMANARLHWAAKARIVKAERQAVALMCKAITPALVPCAVRLTRTSPGELDDDNLRGALKAVRDELARLLGIDDRDPRVRWFYAQAKGKRGQYAVGVEVFR